MRTGYITSILVAAFLVAIAFGIFLTTRGESTPVTSPLPSIPIVKTPEYKVIGTSVQGRNIESYTYGAGLRNLVFVGGIHGGYEWNSVLLAYKLMDYLEAHANAIGPDISVTIIPDANPDAVYKATGKEGRFTEADVPKRDLSTERFNAHGVDLNRNFDCNWAPSGTWKDRTVSGGSAAFSEPETIALSNYLLRQKPDAVIFWHSSAGAVYASQCTEGILPKTLEVMNIYAKGAGYPAVKEFTAYEVHGASEDWLASEGIPAITVELKSHDSVEWESNLAGVTALLKYFSTK